MFFAVTLFLAGIAALIDSAKIADAIVAVALVMMLGGAVVLVQDETFGA